MIFSAFGREVMPAQDVTNPANDRYRSQFKPAIGLATGGIPSRYGTRTSTKVSIASPLLLRCNMYQLEGELRMEIGTFRAEGSTSLDLRYGLITPARRELDASVMLFDKLDRLNAAIGLACWRNEIPMESLPAPHQMRDPSPTCWPSSTVTSFHISGHWVKFLN
jgi:hypothetical protein